MAGIGRTAMVSGSTATLEAAQAATIVLTGRRMAAARMASATSVPIGGITARIARDGVMDRGAMVLAEKAGGVNSGEATECRGSLGLRHRASPLRTTTAEKLPRPPFPLS